MPEVAPDLQINKQPSLEPVPSVGPAKRGRSYIGAVIGVLAVAVALLAVWIGYKALNTGPEPSTNPSVTINTNSTVPEIKSDTDFQKLEDEVNNQDIDGLTKDLDQNDTDAADF